MPRYSTRRTQPYRRKPGRQASPVLQNMTRGATATGQNPANVKRSLQKKKRRSLRQVVRRA